METLPLGHRALRRHPGPVAWLLHLNGPRIGTDVRLRGTATVGRSRSNVMVVEDEAASRQHARIKLEGGRYVLFDLASSAGTYVNGHRIERQTLEDGDVIRIGHTDLKFKQA